MVIVASLATATAAALGGYWRGQARSPRALVQPDPTAPSTNEGARSDEDEKVVEALQRLDRRVAALELRQLLVNQPEARAPAGAPGPGPGGFFCLNQRNALCSETFQPH